MHFWRAKLIFSLKFDNFQFHRQDYFTNFEQKFPFSGKSMRAVYLTALHLKSRPAL